MTLLAVDRITKSFSGLRALDDVSFEVEQGRIVGLIGPNGAGKTTLFNVVAGPVAPDRGRVIFDGQDIAGWPLHRVARAGIGRTFQLMKPFASLSVSDNVKVAAHLAGAPATLDARVQQVLDRVELAAAADRPAGTLSTAGRKRLELARALALRPRLLLLDEVLAGLTAVERQPLIALLRQIRDEGVTLLLVEHVMAAVMSLSDQVLVLHHGQLLAAGTPQEVTRDAAVVEAYLGEELLLADS